jgi:hypothetical protein
MMIAITVMGRIGFAQEEQSAQTAGRATSQSAAQATPQAAASTNRQATIEVNSKINAVLESAIDTRKAKPGDEVSAKVAKDVKQDGKVVVHKGDRLLGKVVSAKTNGTAGSGSQLAVQFDRLESGGTTTELQTVVTSIFNSSATFNEEAPEMMRPAPTALPAPQASGGSASGGGLLGGAGSTVDSTLGAAGSIGNNAGGVLGPSMSDTLGTSAGLAGVATGRGIRVESQGSVHQSTGMNSVFSAPQGDLRLDSGTNLQFRVVGQSEKPSASQSD